MAQTSNAEAELPDAAAEEAGDGASSAIDLDLLDQLDDAFETEEGIDDSLDAADTGEGTPATDESERLVDEFEADAAADTASMPAIDAAALVTLIRGADYETRAALAEALSPVLAQSFAGITRDDPCRVERTLSPLADGLFAVGLARAARRMGEDVTLRIDGVFSPKAWSRRIRATLRAAPVKKIALADLGRDLVARLYVIDRQTAELSAHWPPIPHADTELVVETLARGMDSIQGARLDDEPASVTGLGLDPAQTVLDVSTEHVLAIETRRPVTEAERANLRAAGRVLLNEAGARDGTVSAAALYKFAWQYVRNGRRVGAGRISRGAVIGVVLLALTLAYGGWRVVAAHKLQKAVIAAETVIADRLGPDAGALSVSGDAQSVTVEGLLIGSFEAATLAASISSVIAPFALENRIAVFGPEDVSASVGEAIRAFAERAEASEAKLALFDGRVLALEQNRETQQRWVQTISGALNSPETLLQRWIGENAIFFSSGTAFGAPQRAQADLDTLAALMERAPGTRLRVVGHAGPGSTAEQAERVAFARAKLVADGLIRRGVPQNRLVVRAVPPSGAWVDGAAANRRVEFQPVFAME